MLILLQCKTQFFRIYIYLLRTTINILQYQFIKMYFVLFAPVWKGNVKQYFDNSFFPDFSHLFQGGGITFLRVCEFYSGQSITGSIFSVIR